MRKRKKASPAVAIGAVLTYVAFVGVVFTQGDISVTGNEVPVDTTTATASLGDKPRLEQPGDSRDIPVVTPTFDMPTTPYGTPTRTPIEDTPANEGKPHPRATVTPKPEPKPTATKKPQPKPTATTTPKPKPTATKKPEPKPTATKKPEPKPTVTTKPKPKPTVNPRPTTKPKPDPNPTLAPEKPNPVVDLPLDDELEWPGGISPTTKPTPTPQPSNKPRPTITPTITPTPTATPTATPTTNPGNPDTDNPAWLQKLNEIRAKAGLNPVAHNPQLSAECVKHVAYMNVHGMEGHFEREGTPEYTPEGHKCAKESNLVAGAQSELASFDIWVGSPGHYEGMVRPGLKSVGFAYSNGYGALNVIADMDWSARGATVEAPKDEAPWYKSLLRTLTDL